MPSAAKGAKPIEDGDLVRLEYDLWAETGDRTELVDTTHEGVAQEANLKVPTGYTFGPHPHLIGGEYFPAGIESALVGLPIGDEVEKVFPPAEAFGPRDPKLIELFGMHEIERLPEMRRDDATLDIGTVLTIRGRRGRVVTLTAARVRVDFNPPFAGRTIRGKFRVDGRIDEPAEQVRALIDLTYGHGPEFGADIEDGIVTVRVPDRSKFDLAWAASKPRIIDRIRSRLKPKSIRIVEEYVTPVAKEPAAKAPPAAEPASPPEGAAPADEPPAGPAPHATGAHRSGSRPKPSPPAPDAP